MAARAKHKGLPTHLRTWGLKVNGGKNWKTSGRPNNFYPRAIIVHHTASGSKSGNFSSEAVVTNGRSDLKGPLCHFLLGRDGTVKIISTGYANHAGYGGPKAGIPKNMGNTYTFGIEAENNGVGEPWSAKQLQAYYRLCAALLVWIGKKDVNLVFGHKEWAPGRKIDPAGINMDKFRKNVKKALDAGPTVKTVHLSRLKPGKRNEDVLLVKNALRKKGLYDGPGGKFFGKATRKAYKKWEEKCGVTGPGLNGIPGKPTLQKLGFRVVD